MSQADAIARIAARLPSVFVQRNFLTPQEHSALLEESLANETTYEPSQVVKYSKGEIESGIVNNNTRRSNRRPLEKAKQDIFKQHIYELEGQICTEIGVDLPTSHKFEIEAVHNGDGAFFSRHVDTTFGEAERFRVISAVYYYFAPPRRFSGGELRLFSIDQSQSVTIEPENNMMVFFPSIFNHEVLRVAVPSGEFAHGRFSVNCWINQSV